MSNKKSRVSTAAADPLTPFAIQILLDSDVSLDDCGVYAENVRGVTTNLYSFPSDRVVEDLVTRLRDWIESFRARRGKMRAAYVSLASHDGAQQLELIVTALIHALNSREFRAAKLRERRDVRAALKEANRAVISKTEVSAFKPLRNAGTAKEYRPRKQTVFDGPRAVRTLRKFKPLEPPPEQQLLERAKGTTGETGEPRKPTLDPYRETDIIIPSELSAWQRRLLIKVLS